jgi:HrpA-like RNA helicase
MESKRSKNTKLLFCTTGVILRRLQDDHDLKSITHVIVDEVHERQVQTDVLLIALRQLLRTNRRDLKVILVRKPIGICFLDAAVDDVFCAMSLKIMLRF